MDENNLLDNFLHQWWDCLSSFTQKTDVSAQNTIFSLPRHISNISRRTPVPIVFLYFCSVVVAVVVAVVVVVVVLAVVVVVVVVVLVVIVVLKCS